MFNVGSGISFAVRSKAKKIAVFRNVTISQGTEKYIAEEVTFLKFEAGRDIRASVDGESYFISIKKRGDVNIAMALLGDTGNYEVYEVSKEEGNEIYKQIKATHKLEIEETE